jgi:hypothetical protein
VNKVTKGLSDQVFFGIAKAFAQSGVDMNKAAVIVNGTEKVRWQMVYFPKLSD